MKMKVTSWALGLLLTATLFACNKDDEQLSTEVGIIGKWTVESADVMINGKSFESYVEESISQLKSQLGDSYDEQMAELMKEGLSDLDFSEEFENTTIEFKEDKTAIVTDDEGTQEGTWSVNDKTLIVTVDDVPQTFTVRSLTNSNASLSMNMEMEGFEVEGMDAATAMEVVMNLKK